MQLMSRISVDGKNYFLAWRDTRFIFHAVGCWLDKHLLLSVYTLMI